MSQLTLEAQAKALQKPFSVISHAGLDPASSEIPKAQVANLRQLGLE